MGATVSAEQLNKIYRRFCSLALYVQWEINSASAEIEITFKRNVGGKRDVDGNEGSSQRHCTNKNDGAAAPGLVTAPSSGSGGSSKWQCRRRRRRRHCLPAAPLKSLLLLLRKLPSLPSGCINSPSHCGVGCSLRAPSVDREQVNGIASLLARTTISPSPSYDVES